MWATDRSRLHEQPRHHRVGDRHLVNIAPLQLGEEAIDLHFLTRWLRFKRQGIREIIEVCILTLGHSCSRTHARSSRLAFPSCVTAYPRLPPARVHCFGPVSGTTILATKVARRGSSRIGFQIGSSF